MDTFVILKNIWIVLLFLTLTSFLLACGRGKLGCSWSIEVISDSLYQFASSLCRITRVGTMQRIPLLLQIFGQGVLGVFTLLCKRVVVLGGRRRVSLAVFAMVWQRGAGSRRDWNAWACLLPMGT